MSKNILILVGSLRKKSYNMMVARAMRSLAPKDVAITIFDIGTIPFYNGDVEAQGFPEPVEALRQAILDADGLVIVTPEYDGFIPGVLKNALDWAGRKGGMPEPPTHNKRVGVVSATTGGFGAVRVQIHLAALTYILGMRMLDMRIPISHANERFDEQGTLTDEHLGEKLVAMLDELVGSSENV